MNDILAYFFSQVDTYDFVRLGSILIVMLLIATILEIFEP